LSTRPLRHAGSRLRDASALLVCRVGGSVPAHHHPALGSPMVDSDDRDKSGSALSPSTSAVDTGDVARLRDLVRRGRDHLDRAARGDTALATGIGALYEKRYADAEKAFGRSIAATPDRGEAHYYLGLTRFMLGRHGDAALCYSQAIECGYADPEVVECLGDVLTVMGRDEEAIETYRAALARRPSPHGSARLAEALSRAGRRDEAVAAYKRALQLRLARVGPLYDIPREESEPAPDGE